MAWRRVLKILAVLLILASGLAYGFWPRPVPAEVEPVFRGPLTVSIEEDGRTRIRDVFVVAAPVSGRLRRVTPKVGDAVAAGDPIAELESLRSEALDPSSRAQAEARTEAMEKNLAAAGENIRAARAEADHAARKLARARKLNASGVLAKSDLDQAEAAGRQTSAMLQAAIRQEEAARAERNAAKAVLDFQAVEDKAVAVPILAPSAGVVLRIHQQSEGPVTTGTPLIEIGDPGRLEVVVDVLSADAVRIQPGSRVELDHWGGDRVLHGRVRRVEPLAFTKVSTLGVEEQRVLVVVDPADPAEDWSRLGDGFRVLARFILWEAKDVLQAPTSALFRFDAGWAVFVYENGLAVRRPVQPGRRQGLRTQIVEGLKEGDRVVSRPDDRVAHGARIRVEP